jgi:lipoate-protein ligase A
LSDQEIKDIHEMSLKYQTTDWIYKKQPPYTKVLKQRLRGGLFEVKLDLHESIIKEINNQGDFFDKKPLQPFLDAFKDQIYSKSTLDLIFDNHDVSDYLLDIDPAEFKLFLASGILGE